jgi:hypothetical protein
VAPSEKPGQCEVSKMNFNSAIGQVWFTAPPLQVIMTICQLYVTILQDKNVILKLSNLTKFQPGEMAKGNAQSKTRLW